MMNENHEIESIWADGIPPKLNKDDIFKSEELNDLATDFVARFLIRNGFKLNMNFPRREAPQIFCKKDGKIYAVFTVASVFPKAIWLTNDIREKIFEDSIKNKFIPLFANVLYSSKDKERAKAGLLLKGDLFNVTFQGLRKITEEEQAINIPPNSSFWFRDF